MGGLRFLDELFELTMPTTVDNPLVVKVEDAAVEEAVVDLEVEVEGASEAVIEVVVVEEATEVVVTEEAVGAAAVEEEAEVVVAYTRHRVASLILLARKLPFD